MYVVSKYVELKSSEIKTALEWMGIFNAVEGL
jgi:hypothetical protein